MYSKYILHTLSHINLPFELFYLSLFHPNQDTFFSIITLRYVCIAQAVLSCGPTLPEYLIFRASYKKMRYSIYS